MRDPKSIFQSTMALKTSEIYYEKKTKVASKHENSLQEKTQNYPNVL